MLEKAISKIKSEMEKDNNPYVQVVGAFLLKYMEEDPGAAEKIAVEGKTIALSLNEMRREAEKKKVGNCAVLTDKEGFDVVLKYFAIHGEVSEDAIKAEIQEVKKSEEKRQDSKVDFDVSLDDFLK